MAPPDPEHSDPHRHRDSLDVAFVEYLNGRLGLVTPTRDAAIGPGIEIGIDDEHRPAQLALPHLDPSWQDAGVRRLVAAAEQWAGEFFGEIKDVLRSELYAKYWWLLFLRRLLVDPAKARFYLWATALARFPSGTFDSYTGVAPATTPRSSCPRSARERHPGASGPASRRSCTARAPRSSPRCGTYRP